MSENTATLNFPVQGQSGSLKVVPFGRLGIVSYYYSILTFSLRRTVFEIFDL